MDFKKFLSVVGRGKEAEGSKKSTCRDDNENMATQKSKFKLKQKHKEKKCVKKDKVKDKVEMEDSGVHLEDSSASCKSWDAEELNFQQLQTAPHTGQMENKSEDDSLARDLQVSCRLTSDDVTTGMARSSPQITITPSPRISLSESPQTVMRQAHFALSVDTKACEKYRTSKSAPISPTLDSRDKVQFSLDPDNDDADFGRGECSVEKRDNNQMNRIFRKSPQLERKSSGGPVAPSQSKNRFKKILKPLKRSHSAGSQQDVPAYALFLRHELASRRLTTDPKSLDGGRSGMDRQSSDSDAEEVVEKPTKGKKSGKKSLARDVKEKFSFLRRRNTDTTISGKDGKPAKPSTETVLNWSKQFENLLQDSYGLELFRNFLQSEFSEENLEFWIACEDYKNLKSNKLNAQAQKIYSDFVAIQAPREINLSSKAREATAELAKNPDRHTFESAQRRIQALMETDSYPRFLQSPVYQDLLGDQKINFKFNFT